VTRLEPVTNQVQAQIDVGSADGYFCGGVVATDGAVWIELLDTTLSNVLGLARIDPTTNRVIATVPVPQNAGADPLAVDAQGVWVVQPAWGLFRIDPQTNQAVGLLRMSAGAGVALGAGSVWLTISNGTVLRITPAS
jgi:streptogramin lyase